MKFTTTENTTYRAGIGKIPKAWIEYPEKGHKDSIWQYFHDNIRLWDYDEGGSETHDFVFEDGKAFRLEYEYWSEWYHADDDKNGLKHDVFITEISIDEADVPEKRIGRDWL
jgi:hypothetical protein